MKNSKISNCKETLIIHQPDFMPHLPFFLRLLSCDLFVILDHVQFLRRGWHHRDRIKGPNGIKWLTVPVKKTSVDTPINLVKINNSDNFQHKHLKTISHFYRKAQFYNDLFPEIERIYEKRHDFLIDLNLDLINFFLNYF